MAEIALRTYLEQLDHLIERRQIDEVIAHCRHILAYYPKHLDTYRILGKALLEQGRHGDAADIFERVLSALPDDFIAHVGMSIVREDEANVEAALWHMERAFEAAPANGAVQQELCRLYGRRDGVVPPKARLTRGALARMYAQGGLFVQAEAELKAGLAEDASRVDLLTRLADVYWQQGRSATAAQTCADILRQLPYSQQANRILLDVFQQQGQPNEAALCRQRLEALDPYEPFAGDAAGGPAQVDAARVMLPRLEYEPGSEKVATPDWITSLGVRFEPAPQEAAPTAAAMPAAEGVPEWLQGIQPLAPGEGAGQGATPEPAAEAPPAWLSEANQPAGEAEASPAGVLPGWLAAEAAEPGELPDWLRAEPGESPSSAQPAPDAPADEVETWLKGLEGAPPDDLMEAPATAEATADADLPDWLRAVAPHAGYPAEGEPATGADFTGDVPAWLRDEAAEMPADATPAATLPPWAPGELAAEAPAEPTVGTADTEAVPDWLRDLVPSEASGEAAPAPADTTEPTAAEAAPLADAGEAPEWLAAIAPVEAAAEAGPVGEASLEPLERPDLPHAPEELVEPAEPEAAMPDWLRAAGAPVEAALEVGLGLAEAAMPAAAQEPVAPEAPPVPGIAPLAEAEAHGDMPAPVPGPTEPPAPGTEAWPEWLQPGSAPEAAAPPETAAVDEQAGEDEAARFEAAGEAMPDLSAGMPEWLAGAAQPAAAAEVALPDFLQPASPEAIARAAVPFDEQEGPASPVAEPVAEAEVVAEAELPEWLRSLEPPAAEAEAPLAQAAAPDEDALRWLESVQGQAPLVPIVAAGPTPVETPAPSAEAAPMPDPGLDEAMPAWLRSAQPAEEPELPAGDDEPPVEPPTEPPAEPEAALPDWLAQLPPAGAPAEPALAPEAEPPAQPAEALPDWLRALEPQAESVAEVPGTAAAALAAEPTEAAAEIQAGGGEPPAVEARALPEWLAELAPEPTPVAAATEPPAELAGTPIEADLAAMSGDEAMAWLESLALRQGAAPEELVTWQPEPAGEAAAPAKVQPEPIAGAATPESEVPEAPEARLETVVPEARAAETEVSAAEAAQPPDEPRPEPAPMTAEAATPGDQPGAAASLDEWLAAAEVAYPIDSMADTQPRQPAESVPSPAAGAGAETLAGPAPAEPAPGEMTDTMLVGEMTDAEALAWLEGLAARQGARSEELLTAPEARPEEMPAWLAAEAEPAMPEPAPEPQPPTELTAGADDAALAPAEPEPLPVDPEPEFDAAAAEPADAVPDWLRRLEAEAAAEAPITAEAGGREFAPPVAPDWLSGLEAEAAAPEPAPETLAAEWPEALSPAGEMAQAADAAAAPEAALDEDAAMRWLESLAARQGASTEEMLMPAEPGEAEPPSWVRAEAETAEAGLGAEAELPMRGEPEAEIAPEWPQAPVAAAPDAPAEPAVEPTPEPPAAAPDAGRLSRLADRLAATRRAREAEFEARLEEQRAEQEAARREVEASLARRAAALDRQPTAEPPGEQVTEAEPEPATLLTPVEAPQAPALPAMAEQPGTPDEATARPARRARHRPGPERPAEPAGEPPEALWAAGQAALAGQDYTAAALALGALVRAGSRLEDTIAALQAHEAQLPPALLRLLGDAQMKAGQLQPALDTYRRALSRL